MQVKKFAAAMIVRAIKDAKAQDPDVALSAKLWIFSNCNFPLSFNSLCNDLTGNDFLQKKIRKSLKEDSWPQEKELDALLGI